jgi:hypothetical protein
LKWPFREQNQHKHGFILFLVFSHILANRLTRANIIKDENAVQVDLGAKENLADSLKANT